MDVVAIIGAFFFGMVVGWFIYFTNRYRKGDVQFSDIAILIGIIGGAAVTGLFGEAKASLFGAYGIGLASGFFGYLFLLYRLVKASGGAYDLTWFIDGRRKKLPDDMEIPGDTRPTIAPMTMQTPLQDRMASLETRLDDVVSRSSGVLQNSPLAQALSERDRAIAAVDDALRELFQRMGEITNDAERSRLAMAHEQLTLKHDELVALRLRDVLASDSTRATLAKLNAVTFEIEAEAKRMKTATDLLVAATSIIDRVTKLIGGFLTAFP